MAKMQISNPNISPKLGTIPPNKNHCIQAPKGYEVYGENWDKTPLRGSTPQKTGKFVKFCWSNFGRNLKKSCNSDFF